MEEMDIMGEEEHLILFEDGRNNRDERDESADLFRSEPMKEDLKMGIKTEDRKKKGVNSIFCGESRSVSAAKGEDPYDKFKRQGDLTNLDQLKNTEGTEAHVDKSRFFEVRDQSWTNIRGNKDNWVSVFIGNIPPCANNRWVFENFNIIGKVVDYYVSNKVSKRSKKPFDFAHFQSLEDASRAVGHFNGTMVDGFRLEVELARYPRRSIYDNPTRNSTGLVLPGAMASSKGIGSNIRLNSWINPKKSFAQVVQGSSEFVSADGGLEEGHISFPRIKVKATFKECDWLKAALVAKIKWGVREGDVLKVLLCHVKGLISINILGIRKVILSFISVEDRDVALNLDEWMGMVEEVREWKWEVVCRDKLWKITCSGIPLTAWNYDTFRSIAEVWGSLVHVDPATVKGEDFSVANLVIETTSEVTNYDIDLLVGKDIFPVKISGTKMEVQKGQVHGQHAGVDLEKGDIMSSLKTKLSSECKDPILATNKVADNRSAEFESLMPANLESLILSKSVSKEFNLESVPLNCSNQAEGDEECSVVDGLQADTSIEASPGNICRQTIDFGPDKEDGENDCNQKACPDPIQVTIEPITSKEKELVMWEDDPILRRNESGNFSDMHDLSYRNSTVECGYDLDKIQYGYRLGILSEDHVKNENQNKEKPVFSNGLSGKVEKEIKAMMDLGKLLDITNAYQFKEAVCDATLEEIEEDSNSIGVRVKSKRKYAGKSKVQFGCRVKKG